ncbi:MAG: hypothetical protein BWY60_00891 [Actinobacteria bacterium ADurb.Bin346]|nr:MAG: hypothetical protein BWY60_00891 [Actinobacteria bacterium ADurb.Bin346]
MKSIIRLPHRVCKSTCYINGLEDILEWKGRKYPDYMLSVLGGMGEFSYFRYKRAEPPDMVYFGANPKYLLADLENIIGFKQEIIEDRAFKNTFSLIKSYIDSGRPVVAGALDMFYLHYYRDLYKKQHVPIHYVLVIGYDDDAEEVYVQDCTFSGVQAVSYEEFEKALNVKVPGMSRKNTVRVFNIEENLPEEFELAKKGFNYRAGKMLAPPASFLGIPAMKKLAKEIFKWNDQASFNHLVMYATVPPHVPKKFDNSNGMRAWKSAVLVNIGEKYKVKGWIKAAGMFRQSGELIKDICIAAIQMDANTISKLILDVAEIEEKAYKLIQT